MAQSKPKNIQVAKLVSPPPVSGIKQSGAEANQDAQRIEKFWHNAVEALRSTHFVSFEAALDAVVGKVVEMIDPKSTTSELAAILKLTLSTDPSIEAELRSSLSIG